MPLQAYLDDSGTHDHSPVCVAAGYFGGIHYWKQFDLDWDRAIRHRGLSEFHANRFWSRTPDGKTVGEYKDWSEEDCITFLTELLTIIRRCRVWPVGSAVVLSDWEALTFDERRHLTGGIYKSGRFKNSGAPSKQYFIAFLFAVHNIAAHCDEGHIVNFVVDESRTLNGYAREYFERIKMSNFGHAHKLGTIQSGDSKYQPGLQAADLLAYLTLKRTRENPQVNQEVEFDSPLGQAIRNARDVPLDFKLLGEVAFDRLLQEFRRR
jgi:hypothetical protein